MPTTFKCEVAFNLNSGIIDKVRWKRFWFLVI
jgi:hypothetical protein